MGSALAIFQQQASWSVQKATTALVQNVHTLLTGQISALDRRLDQREANTSLLYEQLAVLESSTDG
eukprot:9923780-Karenia_brevis.AAC.1